MMHPQLLPLKFGPPVESIQPIIGTHNQHIFRLLDQWPHWPFRQWVLWGEPHSGKSMMVRQLMKRAKGVVLTPQHASEKLPHVWLEKPEKLFVLENYDHGYSEEWLFHFYNAARESDVYVIYVGNVSPAQSALQLPDLISRLSTLTSIQVSAPDDTFLQALLVQKLQEKGLTLTEESAAYILKRTERTCAHIVRLSEEIHYWALLEQKDATLSVIRKALNMTDEEVLSSHDALSLTHKISRPSDKTLTISLFDI